MLVAKNTGLRRNNVVHLKWSRFELKEKIIDTEEMKDQQSLGIPLNEKACRVLTGLAEKRYLNLFFARPIETPTHLVFRQVGRRLV